jgi:hypothetical protein
MKKFNSPILPLAFSASEITAWAWIFFYDAPLKAGGVDHEDLQMQTFPIL